MFNASVFRLVVSDVRSLSLLELWQELARIVLDGGDAGSWTFELTGQGRPPVGIVRRFDVAAPVPLVPLAIYRLATLGTRNLTSLQLFIFICLGSLHAHTLTRRCDWQVGESTSSVAVFTNPFVEPLQDSASLF